MTQPLVGFAAYFVFIPVTHLTGLFNLMMEHEWVHHLEQIGFLVVGYLFFRVAFGLERGTTIHRGLRLVFVMAAVPVDTFTGLALAMSSHTPFPAYAAMAPRGSTTAGILTNIHLGGAIMWIGGDALMLLACIPIAIAWVKWETVHTRSSTRSSTRKVSSSTTRRMEKPLHCIARQVPTLSSDRPTIELRAGPRERHGPP